MNYSKAIVLLFGVVTCVPTISIAAPIDNLSIDSLSQAFADYDYWDSADQASYDTAGPDYSVVQNSSHTDTYGNVMSISNAAYGSATTGSGLGVATTAVAIYGLGSIALSGKGSPSVDSTTSGKVIANYEFTGSNPVRPVALYQLNMAGEYNFIGPQPSIVAKAAGTQVSYFLAGGTTLTTQIAGHNVAGLIPTIMLPISGLSAGTDFSMSTQMFTGNTTSISNTDFEYEGLFAVSVYDLTQPDYNGDGSVDLRGYPK